MKLNLMSMAELTQLAKESLAWREQAQRELNRRERQLSQRKIHNLAQVHHDYTCYADYVLS